MTEDMVYRVYRALRLGYVPSPQQKIPKEHQQHKQWYMEAITSAVYATWNKEQKFMNLQEIFGEVKKRIVALKNSGLWPYETIPGKRTIDRMVNFTADRREYPDGKPTIIAVKAGLYMPNPIFFPDAVKQQLEKLMEFVSSSKKKKGLDKHQKKIMQQSEDKIISALKKSKLKALHFSGLQKVTGLAVTTLTARLRSLEKKGLIWREEKAVQYGKLNFVWYHLEETKK